MLSVRDLRVALGAFEMRASFDVPQGRKVAVTGPSGAGKSTLLAALGGYVPLLRGSVEVSGKDVSHAPPDQRGLAMLFQDGNLFPHLTIAQNVGLGLRPSLSLRPDEEARVRESLTRVGLADCGSRKPAALSGGQQSRAALARVLLQAAPLLLLDEPFAALGPALRAEMLGLTADVVAQTGATLMMVTHAPREVASHVDDLIYVETGQVDPPKPVDQMLAEPPAGLRAYLGDAGQG
ncbi:MAG: ATP-binding cassette domain-containing protein [Pseudomonadota bacterium]